MGRFILGLLASLLMVSSLPARANTLEAALYDLLLRPEPGGHIGLTMMKYPSICWILRNKPPVDATIMFTLMDLRSSKPVLEIQLPPSIQTDKNETCDCVNLKDYDIQLEPDMQYRWYVWIARNPESRSRDGVAGGVIEGCAGEECLTRETSSQCDRDFVRRLAIRGFWHESISCLCDLLKSSPEDKLLRRMLDAIMRHADFEFNPK